MIAGSVRDAGNGLVIMICWEMVRNSCVCIVMIWFHGGRQKMRKPAKDNLVVCNGTLYIKAKYAGMHFLCLLIDGIPLTFFGKSKKEKFSAQTGCEGKIMTLKNTI